MRVLLAGSFDPEFNRNRRLRSFLSAAGHDVASCRFDLWGTDRVAVVRTGKVRLIARALVGYPAFVVRFLRSSRPDIVLVPYPGWFDMILLGPLSRLRRIPIVFDPFISLSDTVVSDRRLVPNRGLTPRLLRFVDRVSIGLASRVIADTPEHADFFAGLARIDRERVGVVWVGADDAVFVPRPVDESRPDRVLFYGTYIPLHGAETIVTAAGRLRADGVEFRLIGDGQERDSVERMAALVGATNVEFVPSMPVTDLVDEIASASVCLGIFGESDKAMRVVPNKLFECVAVGRPVVTGDSPAVRTAFPEGALALVPPGDPDSLAVSIRQLLAEPERRSDMATRARQHYEDHYAAERLSELLDAEFRHLDRTRTRNRRDRSPRSVPLSLNARFRWDVVRKVVEQRRPDSILELGAGRGAVASRLARRSAYMGVEPDQVSRSTANSALAGGAAVVASLDEVDPTRRFAMVCAFEVLEHLPDDVMSLRSWSERLDADGVVLISVPAHRHRFGAADAKVGHVRRYDRSDLDTLAAGAGLRIVQVWSTGWPMGRLIEWTWNAVARRRPGVGSAVERTSTSGRWLQPPRVMARVWSVVAIPGLVLQRRRFGSEAGTGWVVLCSRR